MIKNQIVECVPNFSEGRRPEVINAIADSISETDGVKLLHIDSGYDANRTVYTFIGQPDKVCMAVYRAAKTAIQHIDMSKHFGKHPRIGALDVCPLVPVKNITFDELNSYAAGLAKKLGNELNIPVYLYESSATTTERQNLSTIRKGEYEGFAKKIKLPAWKPDFGPAEFNYKTGATVLGVRDFLIAYNINLDSKDIKLAKFLAGRIRGSGYVKKTGNKSMHVPGLFQCVKAIGWFIEEYGKVQVSTNITNYRINAIHEVYQTVKELTNKEGISVTGSEIIGMIPLEPLLNAGKYYSNNKDDDEKILISNAIKGLGLNDMTKFETSSRILDFLI